MKGVMAFRNTIPVQYSGGACVSVVNVVILLVLKDIKSFYGSNKIFLPTVTFHTTASPFLNFG